MMTLGGAILTIVTAIMVYLCLYPFVDRVCKCIEHCADEAAKSNTDEED